MKLGVLNVPLSGMPFDKAMGVFADFLARLEG